MQNLIGPFSDEAVAGLIGAIITAFVAYLIFRKGRQKPNIIICEQQSEIQLIRYGLAEELPLTYGNEKLINPWIIRLVFTNIGSTEILEPTITFKVGKSAKIFRPRFQINPNREIKNLKVNQISDQEITVKLDYLNQINPHNEKLQVDLICDGILENLEVTGSGKGWSVQFKDLKNALRKAFSYAIIGLLILVSSTIYFLFSIIKAFINDIDVSNAFNSLWNNNLIRFPFVIFISGIFLTTILAFIAERNSKISFYKETFYLLPKLFLQQAAKVIFKNKIH